MRSIGLKHYEQDWQMKTVLDTGVRHQEHINIMDRTNRHSSVTYEVKFR